jgi:2-dehydro-3-deoxy-D-arabinonate dehydratase
MKLYKTSAGFFLERDGAFALLDGFELDAWLAEPNPLSSLLARAGRLAFTPADVEAVKPMGSQEVWAAGVTYKRSEEARIEESDFSARAYALVYEAKRPELFFKSTPRRAVGPGERLWLRDDANWSVPEPELVLLVSSEQQIVGYTIGNDLSSRDIEGENLLYLPQAKVWDGSCALGPAILLAEPEVDPRLLGIELAITREGEVAFSGSAEVSRMNRTLEGLVSYLFMNQSFPEGVFLMTGTCIVPPSTFTLGDGDEVSITIQAIGTLVNTIAQRRP